MIPDMQRRIRMSLQTMSLKEIAELLEEIDQELGSRKIFLIPRLRESASNLRALHTLRAGLARVQESKPELQ